LIGEGLAHPIYLRRNKLPGLGGHGATADNGDRANRNDGLKARFSPTTSCRSVPAGGEKQRTKCAQRASGTDQKLNYIAQAIYELAKAIGDIEDDVARIKRREMNT